MAAHGMIFARRRLRLGTLVVAGALLASCSREATLLSDLPRGEAFAIQHALAEVDVQATARPGKDGRMAVTVPREHMALARRTLLEQGLPRPEYRSFGDVFNNEGMLTSPFEERARYLYASSQELENTLRNIEGVVFAKVHVVMPEARSLVRDGVPASASVFLKYRPPSRVATMHAALQRLVANAVPGLVPERVVVVATAVDDHALTPAALFAVSHASAGGISGAGWRGWLSHAGAIAGGIAAALLWSWRRQGGAWWPRMGPGAGMPPGLAAVLRRIAPRDAGRVASTADAADAAGAVGVTPRAARTGLPGGPARQTSD
ncbi:MAG: hypothetical protein ACRYGL_07030 [Janthinobacterium lividum]